MIQMEIKLDKAALNKLLDQVPGMAQRSAFEAGLRPAGKVIERRLRELTPSSAQTGTRKKWTRKVKGERAGVLPLKKTTATKVWRPRTGNAMVLVGYRYPSGNLSYFLIQGKDPERKVMLWGKDAGRSVRKLDLLKRASDDTRSQATAAFTAGVAKDIPKKLERLQNG